MSTSVMGAALGVRTQRVRVVWTMATAAIVTTGLK